MAVVMAAAAPPRALEAATAGRVRAVRWVYGDFLTLAYERDGRNSGVQRADMASLAGTGADVLEVADLAAYAFFRGDAGAAARYQPPAGARKRTTERGVLVLTSAADGLRSDTFQSGLDALSAAGALLWVPPPPRPRQRVELAAVAGCVGGSAALALAVGLGAWLLARTKKQD